METVLSEFANVRRQVSDDTGFLQFPHKHLPLGTERYELKIARTNNSSYITHELQTAFQQAI